MHFDARAAKAPSAGQHITFASYPGLRLGAPATAGTRTYRYKSPVDGRMRQVKIGRWPAMSFPAVIVAWEGLRAQCDAGGVPRAMPPCESASPAPCSSSASIRRKGYEGSRTRWALPIWGAAADYLVAVTEFGLLKEGVCQPRCVVGINPGSARTSLARGHLLSPCWGCGVPCRAESPESPSFRPSHRW